MKKTVMMIAAALCFGYAANAQVTVTPKVGLAISKMDYAHDENWDDETESKTGLTLGVAFTLPVSSSFSVQPELNINSKGYATENNLKVNVNYLEIPVLAKINFGADAIKGFVNAGPYLAYGLGGNATYDGRNYKIKFGEEPSNSNDNTQYLSPKYYNRIELGLQFGGGVAIQAGPGNLVLDARYGLGLSNIEKDYKETISGNGYSFTYEKKADGKHRNFYLTVGYTLPIGK